MDSARGNCIVQGSKTESCRGLVCCVSARESHGARGDQLKDWIEATIMRPDNKEPWIFVATGGFDDPASRTKNGMDSVPVSPKGYSYCGGAMKRVHGKRGTREGPARVPRLVQGRGRWSDICCYINNNHRNRQLLSCYLRSSAVEIDKSLIIIDASLRGTEDEITIILRFERHRRTFVQ